MRSFLVAAVAVVAVSAKPSAVPKKTGGAEPLLTVAGTKKFLGDSLSLSWDLTKHFASTGFAFGYGLVPPPQQAQIEAVAGDVWGKVEKQRMDLGVPHPYEIPAKVMAAHETMVAPHVDVVLTNVRNALFPVEQISNAVVAQFEIAFPASAGLFPADIFDQIFVLFYLVYVVLGMLVLPVVSLICCCGLCASRKDDGAPRPVKPNGKTDMSKKKK